MDSHFSVKVNSDKYNECNTYIEVQWSSAGIVALKMKTDLLVEFVVRFLTLPGKLYCIVQYVLTPSCQLQKSAPIVLLRYPKGISSVTNQMKQ